MRLEVTGLDGGEAQTDALRRTFLRSLVAGSRGGVELTIRDAHRPDGSRAASTRRDGATAVRAARGGGSPRLLSAGGP